MKKTTIFYLVAILLNTPFLLAETIVTGMGRAPWNIDEGISVSEAFDEAKKAAQQEAYKHCNSRYPLRISDWTLEQSGSNNNGFVLAIATFRCYEG